MADDEISPEQAKFEALHDQINTLLIDVTCDEGLNILAAVAAHICTEYDYPQDAGLAFTSEFIGCLYEQIEKIPAESTVTIPEEPN